MNETSKSLNELAPTTYLSGASGTLVATLPNGLAIIVREDHSAPVVSAQAWCMAGSIHEGRQLGAGMSHVLEHMLFKGTETRPGSRIDQEVQAAGGCMNAYTSFDRTVFHIDVPSTGATVALDVLCDVMQNATLPADELEKEKQVILREMDMNTDDPGRRASRRLFESAFTRSPYRFTVIGYPDMFHEISREDLQRYYREKYAPNNVFYVVAGDVTAGEVVRQIRSAYSGRKARFMASEMFPSEPRQTAPREIQEEASIEVGYLHMAWHIPDVRHPDMPALDVASVLLGNGRSSRLYQEVRERQALVHSVDAWTYSPGNEGLLGVSAIVDGDKYGRARDALIAQIEALAQAPVTETELSKAIRQFTSAFLAVRKTMQGQAQDLGGSWISCNDTGFSERYLAAIKRLTPAVVQTAAAKYLTPENRTIYALLPEGAVESTRFVQRTSSLHAPRKTTLPNGLRVLIKPDCRLPFVEMRCALAGGVLSETTDTNGISQLTSRMLLKGTPTRDADSISREIESVGGSLETYSSNNSFGLSVEVLNENFALGLGLLSDALLHPTFPEKALEREREVQIAGIRAQRDHLLHEAFAAMRLKMFGDSGYGLDPVGTEDSVAGFGRQDLLDFHERQVTPLNCVLAIYGDVDSTAAIEAVERNFGKWAAGPVRTPITPAAPQYGIASVTDTREKQQAVIVIGFPGVDLRNPDRYALNLIQEACSDLGSRLFMRVRDTLGLAYYVGAQNFVGISPGFIAFYAGTAGEHAEMVEQELLAETAALRKDGLSEEELERAKAKIIGQRKISRQDLGTLALTHALDELYGLGFDHSEEEDAHLERVSQDEIVAAARRYLSLDAYVISTILPAPSIATRQE